MTSTAACAFITIPPFRSWLFEVFLRLHQLLSAGAIVATWIHVSDNSLTAKIIMEAIGFLFGAAAIGQLITLLCRRGTIQLAPIKHSKTSALSRNAVLLRISLRRPVHVHAGQYVFLYVPGISCFSFLQNHPFMVVSWNSDPTSELEIFVQGGKGFSKKLVQCLVGRKLRAFVTGPFGLAEPMKQFRSVILFATESGIASFIARLRELVSEHGSSNCFNTRTHLIWQVQNFGMMQSHLH